MDVDGNGAKVEGEFTGKVYLVKRFAPCLWRTKRTGGGQLERLADDMAGFHDELLQRRFGSNEVGMGDKVKLEVTGNIFIFEKFVCLAGKSCDLLEFRGIAVFYR